MGISQTSLPENSKILLVAHLPEIRHFFQMQNKWLGGGAKSMFNSILEIGN
jgi:hypothetical protein